MYDDTMRAVEFLFSPVCCADAVSDEKSPGFNFRFLKHSKTKAFVLLVFDAAQYLLGTAASMYQLCYSLFNPDSRQQTFVLCILSSTAAWADSLGKVRY